MDVYSGGREIAYMSKKRREAIEQAPVSTQESCKTKTGPSRIKSALIYLKTHLWITAIILLIAVGTLGAGLKYLQEDAKRELAKNTENRSLLSSVNPFVPPSPPTPTPQLSKEYIYAGSRLLAVEDAGASAVPPADLAVWRPSDGYWYVMGGTGSAQTFHPWGASGDQPAPGDYDGDGKTDFAIYRASEGNWYIVPSSTGSYYAVAQGGSGYKVAQGDYDGDGKTDTALFNGGTWYVKKSSDSSSYSQAFGLSTDKIAPGDFDGDGKTDIAVWRGSDTTFYVLRSTDGNWFSAAVGSASTDTPVPCDYSGDGIADMSVLNGNNWIIRNSATGSVGSAITWQNSGDIPVQNDYDGDGKCDVASWRNSNGNWYIRQSGDSNSLRNVAWGMSGDIPVPAFYRR